MQEIRENKRETIILSLLLFLFLLCTAILNLRYMNRYLTSDMYGDLWVAKLMWEQKTLFPTGWIFGNQIYIFATPNLAALVYGITNNMLISMGVASNIMVLIFIFTFYWTLKPSMSICQILVALVALFASFCTTNVCSNQYAQLYFIGCTFYICYAITLLINIGVLVRIYQNQKIPVIPMVLAILLSLAMGVQSSRQTLIMVLPFIFLSICYALVCRIKKNSVNNNLLIFIGGTSLSNIVGYVISKIIDVERDAIIGGLGFSPCSNISGKITSTIRNAISLIGFDDVISFLRNSTDNILSVSLMGISALIFLLLSVLGVIKLIQLIQKRKAGQVLPLICCILGVSCLAVFGAFMTLDITRLSKYYFIYYVLTSILVSVAFCRCKRIVIKALFLAAAFVVLVVSYVAPMVKMELSTTVYEEISQYMVDNNYGIVYSDWDNAGNTAGASNCRIIAGRWDASDIFQIKGHTNVMDIYTEHDNSKALYLLTEITLVDAERYFDENSIDSSGFECLAVFYDESGNAKYLYKSNRQLMH